MSCKRLVQLLVVALCFFLLTPSFSLAGSEEKPVYLHVSGGSFDPLKVQKPSKQPSKKAQNTLSASSKQQAKKSVKKPTNYHLIQFFGPILSSWRKAVKDTGAVILEYIPDFAYLVRATPDQIFVLKDIPSVRWVGPWKPSYTISSTLPIQSKPSRNLHVPASLKKLTLVLFPGEDIPTFEAKVLELGGKVMHTFSGKTKSILRIELPASGILPLSKIPGVWRIEPTPKRRLMNNISTNIMKARKVRKTYGLTGKGQIVGVADSGLDTGDKATIHEDFWDGKGHSRILWIGDNCEDTEGHGTHVAGSIAGNGKCSGSDPANSIYPPTCFAGMAPEAQLVVQKIIDEADVDDGEGDDDLSEIFQPAWNKGVRIHSNSWGGFSFSTYNDEAKSLDEFVWNHRTFLPVFSAGNSGVDHNGNGVIDLYSICTPATAKNCLTIGASEGWRTEGRENDTYGNDWPSNFPENPIADDQISNNTQGMAAFSSRGPVLDGRYKPDLIAPGTNILSTLSSVAQEIAEPYDAYYCWDSGTSMSTPLTTGATALARQYLNEYRGIAEPSAALLKAVMLNGAANIAPGQYGTGDTQEIPDGLGPNNVCGWGRVNVETTVFPQGKKAVMYFDEGDNAYLDGGKSKTFPFKVTDSSIPLKINLVWTDASGTEESYGKLVNDLDLSLQTPDAKTLYPDNAQNSTLTHPTKGGTLSDETYVTSSIAIPFTASDVNGHLESLTFCPVPKEEVGEETTYLRSYEVSIWTNNTNEPGDLIWNSSERRYTLSNESSPETIFISSNDPRLSNASLFVVITNYNSTLNYAALLLGTETNKGCLVKNASNEWEEVNEVPYVQLHVRRPDEGNHFDRVNNAVGIEVPNPSQGNYTVTVKGYNVPTPWQEKGQPYALVISGGIEAEQTIEIPVPTKQNNPGGRILPNGKVLVMKGKDVIFSIIPDPGYEVKNVIANGNISLGAYEKIALSDILKKLEENSKKTTQHTPSVASKTSSARSSKRILTKGASKGSKLTSLSATFAKKPGGGGAPGSGGGSGGGGGCLFFPASSGDMLLWFLPVLALLLLKRQRQR